MSARHNLTRLERDVRAVTRDEPAAPPADIDGDQLAREVTRAFLDELDRYKRLRTAEPQRLNPADPPEGWELDSVRTRPPDQVTFGDLNRLAQADPAAAQAQWQAVKTAARDDLDTGWLAARAVEYQGGSAWERACFLAVRDRLRRAWRPRTDGEAMLIDEIAQYDVVRLWWVGVLAARSRDPLAQANRKAKSDSADDRRQSAAEATVEAGRMVERLQRLSQNAVRLLVHLRRGSSTTIFQRSGQVNVGVGQQLNVGPTAAGTAPEADGPSEDLT
jgi:hypothetical protein